MKLAFYPRIMARTLQIKASKITGRFAWPYKYNIISTYLCNSRCKTCGIWKIYRDKPEKLKKEITVKDMCDAIETVRNQVLWLNVTGGEPVMKKDIQNLFEYVYDRCPNLCLINSPTNGLATARLEKLFGGVAEYCPKVPVYVTLSLDALGQDYTSVRGVKKGYEKVIDTAELLKNLSKEHSNLHLSFQLTLSHLNYDKAYDTFSFIKRYDLPIVTFATITPYFHNLGKTVDARYNADKIMSALTDIERYYPVRSVKDLAPKVYLKLARLYLKNGAAPVPCGAGRSTITIDPYGYVLPCASLYQKIGNLRDFEFNLAELLKSEDAQKSINIAGQCRKCWMNCEALPSMVMAPISTLKALVRTR